MLNTVDFSNLRKVQCSPERGVPWELFLHTELSRPVASGMAANRDANAAEPSLEVGFVKAVVRSVAAQQQVKESACACSYHSG